MSYHVDDTIVAVASAAGGAPRAIVRLSGASTPHILQQLFESASGTPLAQTRAATALDGAILLERTHEANAQPALLRLPAVLYFWPTGRSYTREISAELHTLGSPPLVEAVLGRCTAAGARLAEPGEFTLRAFLSGRLDLTQAEAVLGVVNATGQDELQTALRQLSGGMARPLAALRESLVELLAHLEAGLDFAEEDIEFIEKSELVARLDDAAAEVARLLAQMTSRSATAASATVVLTGAANAGKSCLYNALCGDDRAIVSARAGTTRDALFAELDFGGATCRLVDTAGLNEGADLEGAAQPAIENAAQELAHEQRRVAKLRLVCVDASLPVGPDVTAALAGLDDADVLVWTKCDHDPSLALRANVRSGSRMQQVRTSAVTGEGVDELRQIVAARLRELPAGDADVVSSTAARCRASLERAAAALGDAVAVCRRGGGEELVAADLRAALDELGHVAGAVYTDDILDRIFSRFCIGK